MVVAAHGTKEKRRSGAGAGADDDGDVAMSDDDSGNSAADDDDDDGNAGGRARGQRKATRRSRKAGRRSAYATAVRGGVAPLREKLALSADELQQNMRHGRPIYAPRNPDKSPMELADEICDTSPTYDAGEDALRGTMAHAGVAPRRPRRLTRRFSPFVLLQLRGTWLPLRSASTRLC